MRRSTSGLTIFASVVFGGFSSAAHADDWTGISFGAGGGYGMVNHELNVSEGPLIPPPIAFDLNVDGLAGEGGFFTLGVGADYQINSRFLIGAFFDYDFMNLDTGLSLAVPPLGGLSASANMEVEDQWSIGGRVGYLANPATLLFVSAGYSHADVSDLTFAATIGGTTTKGVLAGIGDFGGAFVGAGFETKLSHGFSLKAEYRYTNLQSERITLLPDLAPAINDFVTTELAPDIQTVRLSLNYRYGLGSKDQEAVHDASSGPVNRSWTGPYAGIGGGYGAANNNVTLTEGPALPPGFFTVDLDGLSHKGGLFTMGAGYDIQTHPSIVVGGFIDYDLASIEHEDTLSVSFGAPVLNVSLKTEFENILMIGARAGYLTAPDTLLFATAGYARSEMSNLTFAGSIGGGNLAGVLASGETYSGFFAGAGVETMLTSDISLKAEYRYIDLGSEPITLLPGLAPAINNFVSTEFDPVIQTGRVSINYRFGGSSSAGP